MENGQPACDSVGTSNVWVLCCVGRSMCSAREGEHTDASHGALSWGPPGVRKTHAGKYGEATPWRQRGGRPRPAPYPLASMERRRSAPMRGDDHVVQCRRVYRHTPLDSARGPACRRGAAAGPGLPDRLPGDVPHPPTVGGPSGWTAGARVSRRAEPRLRAPVLGGPRGAVPGARRRVGPAQGRSHPRDHDARRARRQARDSDDSDRHSDGP